MRENLVWQHRSRREWQHGGTGRDAMHGVLNDRKMPVKRRGEVGLYKTAVTLDMSWGQSDMRVTKS